MANGDEGVVEATGVRSSAEDDGTASPARDLRARFVGDWNIGGESLFVLRLWSWDSAGFLLELWKLGSLLLPPSIEWDDGPNKDLRDDIDEMDDEEDTDGTNSSDEDAGSGHG